MNHTQLNDDVLLHIASFADKDTLRTLMQTCPLLLHYGARRLLQDGVSLDEDDKRIWSFVTFMLKKGHSYRLKLLHSLRLTSPIYYSPHRPMLSRVTGMALATLFQSVALSGDLRSLCIFDSERFLRLHPSVPVAISMITTLEWLDVMEAGLCTVSMLGKLRSPLTRARIALAAPGREEGGTLSAYARNPMWLLRCFSHTLNRVSVTNSTCALVGPWYPHVTYLHLNSADILHTYKYVRAFPNLAVLCTNDCGVMIPPEEYEPRRARNMMDQTAFGTWASLRCYEGSFLTLYMLGITRRIPKVVINHDEDHPDYEMIRTVLDDARPIQFELSLDGAYWLLDPEFWPTFTHDGVDALRYLKLDIMLSTADEATDLPAALEAVIVHVIKPLQSLVALWIVVDLSWYFRLDRAGPLSAEGDPLLVPMEEALVDWDLDAYAHRIQDEAGGSATALRSISVSLSDHRTLEDTTVTLGLEYEPDVWSDEWADDEEAGILASAHVSR